ncbi:MAG: electron transfer flavoprotein subunit beta/FixA family protein [Burkholderiaceae bacterium]|nr:electron transfer flavoprotein subunit beta/FixA family protein [Burkholderiaceae bacterium]
MKVLVAVKRVVDYNVKVRLNAEGQPDTATVKMSMNPFDEIASEMAVQLKEKGKASEVVAVTIGGAKSVDTLRTAMAIGADRGIHITTEETLQPLVIAKLLAKVVEKEQPSIVLLGKQAIDNDAGQVGQMLAALCDIPQATFANKLDVVSEQEALVTRDVDGGVQTVAVKLPAVVTADLRLAEPRYVTLPNMMKARKKPVEAIDAATMGVDLQPRLQHIGFAMPQKQKSGEMLTSVADLVTKLQTEAKVL